MEALATRQSTAKQPALPDWVERLFLRLQTLYGALWIDRWRDAPMDLVHAEWYHGLKRFDLQAIKGGIDWCRDHQKFPPTLPDFIDACQQARPRPESVTTRAPRLGYDRDAAREQVRVLVERVHKRDPPEPLDCFRQIIKEAEEGTYTNWYGLKMAREALGIPTKQTPDL